MLLMLTAIDVTLARLRGRDHHGGLCLCVAFVDCIRPQVVQGTRQERRRGHERRV